MSGVYCGSYQVTRGAGGFAHNCSPLGYAGLRVQISSATIPPSQLGVCGCGCFTHHWWTELLELAHSAPAVKVVYLTRAAAQFGLPQRAELLGPIRKYTLKLWPCLLLLAARDAEGGSTEMLSCKGEKRFVLAEKECSP